MSFAEFDINFSLKGKIALVTGAAKGIGKAIAVLYAEKGADVILIDISDEVLTVEKTIRDLGRNTLVLKTDLTKRDQIKSSVERALNMFGRIDILVNCAGVVFLDDAENLSEEDWDITMAVNLKAPFILSQFVAHQMIKQKAGCIVNIASQAGFIALDKHIAYTASKAAIIGITKVMAAEWAEYGIRVNAVSPTVILTELGKKAWAGPVGDAMKKKIPVGRFGQPEEVAACAVFLASDAAGMITGSNLVIDGGYTIQ
ncbi:D-threitol dehydrogenase [Treponema sp. OMZ 840]|uniref:GolD/DthD family dehydrogenase n=1 Tax=Treponema sp. OMZ 840 TaxID=244313 RepID=UPI003D914184